MREQIPNIITSARILAVAPLCWLLWHEAWEPALAILVVAALSDGLDGFLARYFGWRSRLGALLDPLADKLFIVSITLVFGLRGHLPGWLVGMILIRDVIILGGALAWWHLHRTLEMKPLFISKVNTALQLLLLAVTLVQVAFYPLPPVIMTGLYWLVGITTVLSGSAYVLLWSLRAIRSPPP
ncbi:MAG: CDP-alcohol phosphatidyltransferase family protein [Thiothrix sp.]|nr:CDP-alcohol phosphatidyltransferase family protein [Thiothrix sp.]HPQ95071.1 CDP-alcohol phosphatidyltransferase family protein [Thiolinea sp.]